MPPPSVGQWRQIEPRRTSIHLQIARLRRSSLDPSFASGNEPLDLPAREPGQFTIPGNRLRDAARESLPGARSPPPQKAERTRDLGNRRQSPNDQVARQRLDRSLAT